MERLGQGIAINIINSRLTPKRLVLTNINTSSTAV